MKKFRNKTFGNAKRMESLQFKSNLITKSPTQ